MTRPLLLMATCALVACGEQPTMPRVDPGPDPDPIIASVSVTSDVGDVFAIGGSSLLSAQAAEASGAPVTTTLAWSSSDPSVATVSAAGLMTATAPGSTNITAAAGSISGTLAITVADADLTGLRALLDDPFAQALINGLTADASGPLDQTWAECEQALTEGHLSLLQVCAAEARTSLTTDSDAPTRPLRSLMELFVDWLDRLLNTTTVS